jgi:hypothetical protein
MNRPLAAFEGRFSESAHGSVPSGPRVAGIRMRISHSGHYRLAIRATHSFQRIFRA